LSLTATFLLYDLQRSEVNLGWRSETRLTSEPFGLLHPLPVPSQPRETATVDFVVFLPPANYQGQVVDSILTATCPLSKMVVLMPLASTATAEKVAQVVFDSVFRRFGSPVNLVSDRDPKFALRDVVVGVPVHMRPPEDC
jgi:hypothetical protein